MGAKIVKDPHYTHDNRGNEVFTLIVTKDELSSFGRSYTIPELQDIAETIIKFLEKRQNEI
jgi:hypothetical protein